MVSILEAVVARESLNHRARFFERRFSVDGGLLSVPAAEDVLEPRMLLEGPALQAVLQLNLQLVDSLQQAWFLLQDVEQQRF